MIKTLLTRKNGSNGKNAGYSTLGTRVYFFLSPDGREASQGASNFRVFIYQDYILPFILDNGPLEPELLVKWLKVVKTGLYRKNGLKLEKRALFEKIAQILKTQVTRKNGSKWQKGGLLVIIAQNGKKAG